MSKTVGFMAITPAKAQKWLEEHQDVVNESGLKSLNRIINDNWVTELATHMKNGTFHENGETIKRAKSGRILDGQHRLWACVNAGVSFRCAVVEGFSDAEAEAAFITIDIGRAKKAGDFLAAEGGQYTNIVPPAARFVMSYNEHKSLTKKHMVSTPDIVQWVRGHERMIDSAAFVSKHKTYAPLSVCAAWHYLMFEKNQEEAAKFIEDLETGAGLTKGDPVHAMRERLIQSKGSRINRINSTAVFALGLNMWNDRRKGVKRQVIKSQQLDYSHLPKLV
jgi:hypothetical protein